MLIIRGRGNRRRSFEFPCAEIVNRSPEKEKLAGLDLLCSYMNVPKPDYAPILEGA